MLKLITTLPSLLNQCRDLLFHVQDHRFTIPQIVDSLDVLNLKFLRFEMQDQSEMKTLKIFTQRKAIPILLHYGISLNSGIQISSLLCIRSDVSRSNYTPNSAELYYQPSLNSAWRGCKTGEIPLPSSI